MKRIILIAIFAFCLVPFAFETANAQSRTNQIFRPCPAGTTPTRATVAIARDGSITVTPCSGKTVVTNGVKVYRALLTQTGTNAPVATVLENSLGGTVVWARSNVGTYTATLVGAFPAGKTFFRVGSSYAPTMVFGLSILARTSDDVIGLDAWEFDVAGATEGKADGALAGTSIEILVYP